MVKIFVDPRCLLHTVPVGYPEVPERVRAVVEELRQRDLDFAELGDHPERVDAIARVHSQEYIRRFKDASVRGDELLDTDDTPLSEGTWDAAVAAVDTVLHAADYIADSAGNKAMAVVRPPGHHAERSKSMGFCYFNNIAVAADYLRHGRGFGRVAIFDFDVHHGNGTQHIFEHRVDVLYASTHRYPFYPGTGAASERGQGEGVGATVNVPLSVAGGDADHEHAFRETIFPALENFGPDVLLISAGFDSWKNDPLGGMSVSESGFRDWGRWLARLAGTLCEGRMLVALEGGYDISALPGLVAAYIEELGD